MSDSSQGRETLTLGPKAKLQQAVKTGRHDKILDQLVGGIIRLYEPGRESPRSVTLLGHDRYTLTVQTDNRFPPTVLFKHALEGFAAPFHD